MTELHERVAILETKMDLIHKNQEKIISKIDGMHITLTKYRTWIGAVVFVMTGIGIFLKDILALAKTLLGGS